MTKHLERSSIAKTLQAAREMAGTAGGSGGSHGGAPLASLANPSRPMTQESRSLFQTSDELGGSRPSSGFAMDQLRFVRDTYGANNLRSSLSSASGSSSGRPPAIPEEGRGGDGRVDIMTFDDRGQATAEYHGVSRRRK